MGVWRRDRESESKGDREGEEERDLASASSTHKWLKMLVLGQLKPGARHFFQVSHRGSEAQRLGPPSTVFLSIVAGRSGLELEQPGLKLAFIWDASSVSIGFTHYIP